MSLWTVARSYSAIVLARSGGNSAVALGAGSAALATSAANIGVIAAIVSRDRRAKSALLSSRLRMSRFVGVRFVEGIEEKFRGMAALSRACTLSTDRPAQ